MLPFGRVVCIAAAGEVVRGLAAEWAVAWAAAQAQAARDSRVFVDLVELEEGVGAAPPLALSSIDCEVHWPLVVFQTNGGVNGARMGVDNALVSVLAEVFETGRVARGQSVVGVPTGRPGLRALPECGRSQRKGQQKEGEEHERAHLFFLGGPSGDGFVDEA